MNSSKYLSPICFFLGHVEVPNFKCPKCGKSSKDIGVEPEDTHTMYPEGFQV